GCEVDRGRRLADSALLVGDRKSARAHAASLRVAADVSRTPIANGGLSEWALLRYTGTAREARGRPRQLLEHEQTRELFGWSAAEALRDAADGLGVRAQPDEQDDRSGHSDQRQAPLSRHGRSGKRLRGRHAVLLGRLLLGSALDDLYVRKLPGDLAQKRALAFVRLEERHLPVGQRRGERDPRSPTAGANVDDRPREALDGLHPRNTLFNVHTPRFLVVTDRRQPRRRAND